MMVKEKALIAMSGGVDSAVAALLLQKNYDLTGITMNLWDNASDTSENNAAQAKQIADALGFPHLTLDLYEAFRNEIVEDFITEYKSGKTPNPCVRCNKIFKFGKLSKVAQQLNIPFLATGHYAKTERLPSGEILLKKALDESKDQSYFLWSISKEILPHVLFPLGEYSKPEIREIAAQNGLVNAHRSDSQDICFIPNGDYILFIKTNSSDPFSKGNFIDINGNILGEHQGIECYTIGQRKGLGIALGKPMFVGKKNICDNTVTLCSDSELYQTTLYADSVNILTDESFERPVRLLAKIRYRHTPAIATITRIFENVLQVIFDEPQRAIASGQSLVLYDNDIVVGGGIIK